MAYELLGVTASGDRAGDPTVGIVPFRIPTLCVIWAAARRCASTFSGTRNYVLFNAAAGAARWRRKRAKH